jgi:hypothetical protein
MKLLTMCAGVVTGLAFAGTPAVAQVVFEEQFSYPGATLLTTVGYTAHSGSGSTPVAVTDGSLVYPSYAPTEIGNSLTLSGGSGTREDVNHTFIPVSYGSVYLSFLISVTSFSTSGDYFVHLGPANLTTVFRAKVLAKTDASGALAFGLSKSSSVDSAISWTPFAYSTGTTYLLVLKYAFSAGTTNDDRVDLWVDPSTGGAEPSSDIHQTDSGTDASEIASVAFRQGSSSYSLRLDAVELRLSWFDNPLPIQLVRFAGAVGSKGVTLSWTTASEIACYGFEVQRSGSREGTFTGISGIIPGHGTTSTPEDYSFFDSTAAAGWYYRLRQIDLDQSEHFSDVIRVGVTSVSAGATPVRSRLLDCYPNPFNPSTTIPFVLGTASHVRLKVVDLLGRVVTTLQDGRLEPGEHQLTWNAEGIPAGLYLLVAEFDQRRETRKLVLLK